MDKKLENYREFLKDSIRLEIDFRYTDQSQGIAAPPVQKPFKKDATLIDLISYNDFADSFPIDLTTAIASRESIRSYSDTSLTIKELSYLLWATQGLKEMPIKGTTLRTVPSAGARHSFETYLYIRNVEDLDEGIYRYLPLDHKLLYEFTEPALQSKIISGTLGQSFTASGAVTFIWTTIPNRMEWRYSLAAHKVIAIDVGHVCQNLYLACEAINAGTCAIAAYHQKEIDSLLRLNTDEEFVIYLAPVGKK